MCTSQKRFEIITSHVLSNWWLLFSNFKVSFEIIEYQQLMYLYDDETLEYIFGILAFIVIIKKKHKTFVGGLYLIILMNILILKKFWQYLKDFILLIYASGFPLIIFPLYPFHDKL